MTGQLIFDLALRPALSREDFLVTESNAAAVALVDQWPVWPSYAAAIIGPPGSGKSHLAEVFRQRSHAQRITADELTVADVPHLTATKSLVIEDCDAAPFDETALFHTFNLARQNSYHLLLTAVVEPRSWNISLPDLASRLNATPVVPILLPDDTLLRGAMIKQFNDRQLAVTEPVIAYLVQRMPRSLDAVRAIVDEIDQRAMVERAEITRPFVARILSRFTSPALFTDDI